MESRNNHGNADGIANKRRSNNTALPEGTRKSSRTTPFGHRCGHVSAESENAVRFIGRVLQAQSSRIKELFLLYSPE